MADTNGISNWIVGIEDNPRHPGAIEDLHDGAGLTRFGITSKWHSADVPADFFTTMDSVAARAVAWVFYKNKFCTPLSVDQIVSTEVAASLVSFAVNDNSKIAVETLQTVLGVHTDGALGPVTLAELNSKDPVAVAAQFRAEWADFYHRDVQLNPSKQQFLDGWLRRAALVYPATL